MKILRKIRNYLCYCGIEKEEYQSVKKDAYASNFVVWRILHIFMVVVFGFLFINSLMINILDQNRIFYMVAFIYSTVATGLIFFLKKDSIWGQLLIYLSIIMLLVLGCFVSSNKADIPATSFYIFLIITPLFMIDKPYYTLGLLLLASTGFAVWMYYTENYDVWKMDLVNTLIFTPVAMFIHVLANSIRIKEFVLIKQVNIQKDKDFMTDLLNKGALIREINNFVGDKNNYKGMMLFLDIDHFKPINDTYGHVVGDEVIKQLGSYLSNKFTGDEIVGRFGGDEFIVFIKGSNDPEYAGKLALEVLDEASNSLRLPDNSKNISVSMGICLYHGEEKDYTEIFKKADTALYKVKAKRELRYYIYK